MNWEQFWENFEKIDDESVKINEMLDGKEQDLALLILNSVDNLIPDVDIDLAFDKENNNYYFISNNTNSLNIPFDITQLIDAWYTLAQLFKTDIQLLWSLFDRSIKSDTWRVVWAEETIINDDKLGFEKNDIEELFIFVMKSKGINTEDWEIAREICANWEVNNDCKEALWNKED